MDVELVKAATKMGYRAIHKHGKEMLAKPVGFTLFTISETKEYGVEFSQWFIGANDKILLWNRDQYFQNKYDNFLYWIKYCENWIARGDIATDKDSEFEFLTIEQQLMYIL